MAATEARVPTPTTSAATMVKTVRRMDRWLDALWAPSLVTGKILASSLPERRAWGAANGIRCRRKGRRQARDAVDDRTRGCERAIVGNR